MRSASKTVMRQEKFEVLFNSNPVEFKTGVGHA